MKQAEKNSASRRLLPGRLEIARNTGKAQRTRQNRALRLMDTLRFTHPENRPFTEITPDN